MASMKDYLISIVKKVRGGSTKVIYNRPSVGVIERNRTDIQSWRKAMIQAEGSTQNRARLYDLYEDIVLDSVVTSGMQKRRDRVTNRELVFARPDGTVIEDVTDLATKSYFQSLLENIVDAKFYGHSLIELYWPAPGEDVPGETYLVNRKHVKPRWGLVVENPYDMEGHEYRKSRNIIEVGGHEDLGLLLKVAPYAIYKKSNYSYWADFTQIFGMPFRLAKYNNPESRKQVETMLRSSGAAGWMAVPDDVSLEFLSGNASGQGAEVFRQKRDACNQDIALILRGNTMTTLEAKNSGYAQSKTQQQGEDEMDAADRRELLRILNEKLKPLLEMWGYAVQDGQWSFVEHDMLSLSQRADMDLKLATVIDIPESYWREKYGIPKPTPAEAAALDAERKKKADRKPDDELPSDDKDKDPPPGKLNARAGIGAGSPRIQAIHLHYAPHGADCKCGGCLNLTDELPDVDRTPVPTKIERAVTSAVWNGKMKSGTTSKQLHKHYYRQLHSAARTGFARSLAEAENWRDFELQQGIRKNLSAFAAAKQQALIEELSNLPRTGGRAQFELDAARIMKRHHGQYLRAEVNTVEVAAHHAGMWPEYLENADLYPNLKYTSVGDDRVREKHRRLDGAVYPVGDAFWNTHTPPMDYMCRCAIVQTDEEVSTRDHEEPRPGFGKNPYKANTLLQYDHPYFDMPKADFDTLTDAAEELRAAMELKGVRKRARTQVQRELQREDVGTVSISHQDIDRILASPSGARAVRDNLLTVLDWTLAEATVVSISETTAVLEVSLLNAVFRITMTGAAEGYAVSEIVAL